MPKGYVKSKPREERVVNPFMKKDVKIISDDLTNAARENISEAVARREPVRKRKNSGGAGPTIGATRG